MLMHLTIKNIVLIKQCTLELRPGLCVITGETGAGKSILLDALSLVLGQRADSALVRTGEPQGSITAQCDIAAHGAAQQWLQAQGIEAEDTVLLRRVITASGTSRAFIQDTPVSVQSLRALGGLLVQMHTQHAQHRWLEAEAQRQWLDGYAQLEAQAAQVRECYHHWQQAHEALQTLRQDIETVQKEEEYLRHIVQELEALAPQAGEEEELDHTRRTLMQHEAAAARMEEIHGVLTQPQPVEEALYHAQRMIMRMDDAPDAFAQVSQALERASLDIAEAHRLLQELRAQMPEDMHRLDAVQERLFSLREAARKHRIECDALPQMLHDAQHKLCTLDAGTQALAQAQEACDAAKAEYATQAQTLHRQRCDAAERLAAAVQKELQTLKMPQAAIRMDVEMLPETQWHAAGMDRAVLMARLNPGSDWASVARAASGGELSRLMLALALSLQGRGGMAADGFGAMVFDEIDTGTGGAVADAIGQRLAALAEQTQVLVVTHMPQVAACGAQHVHVHKTVKGDTTTTHVAELDATARKEELARMLAGADVTAEARQAAGKLLEATG